MFFGVILEPGKQYQQEPDMPLHLSMATIQPAVKQATASIVSVYCHSEENEKFLICSLHPENTYQVPLDLTFIEGQTVTLSTEGPGKVHLTGYYMPETEMDFDDEEDSEIDEEVESEDLDADDVAETQKRPNAAKEVTGPAAKKVKVEQKKEVKPEAKKDAGKMNGQAARAIPAADDDSDDEDDADESGDEEDLNALLADIKKARGKQESGAGDQMNVSANDDEDEEDDEDDDDEDDAEMDEEDSDDDNVAEQQKQLKQSLNKEPKQQNGGQIGKGAVKPQGKWQQDGKAGGRPNQQFGGQQRGGGGGPHRGGGGFQRGGGGRGGFQKGGRGSPGNKSPGFRDQSRGRGGGTPFNKKRNFSPHGNSGQKAGGFGGKRS